MISSRWPKRAQSLKTDGERDRSWRPLHDLQQIMNLHTVSIDPEICSGHGHELELGAIYLIGASIRLRGPGPLFFRHI